MSDKERLNELADVARDGDIFTSTGGVTAANKVIGDHATVIGRQYNGLSEEFVRALLAEKDRQIKTLLAILSKYTDSGAAAGDKVRPEE